MNGTITITKRFQERYDSYSWGASIEFDNGVKPLYLGKYGGTGFEKHVPQIIEENLDGALIFLTDRKETGVNLAVKLPQGVTLSDAYKTQVTTRYTADGTIATITFE
ncbi:hypothetical protein [Paenibacillus sp. HGF5]|uniref:hypothetical protein n=1 Tax=Paenibacillus sp. HGF5 TaxID=908341 RepID=UPI0002072A1D|nr:hypothetical protein [Paenibacillus sp. HGF5]EGG36515.1 hypothetical protein HMPREF9412_6582 [Paenibacillus sp. HGF5]